MKPDNSQTVLSFVVLIVKCNYLLISTNVISDLNCLGEKRHKRVSQVNKDEPKNKACCSLRKREGPGNHVFIKLGTCVHSNSAFTFISLFCFYF